MACFFHSTNNMDSNLKLKLNPLAEQGASLANAKVLRTCAQVLIPLPNKKQAEWPAFSFYRNRTLQAVFSKHLCDFLKKYSDFSY